MCNLILNLSGEIVPGASLNTEVRLHCLMQISKYKQYKTAKTAHADGGPCSQSAHT